MRIHFRIYGCGCLATDYHDDGGSTSNRSSYGLVYKNRLVFLSEFLPKLLSSTMLRCLYIKIICYEKNRVLRRREKLRKRELSKNS